MRLLFVADIHYVLRQFDWLATQTSACDVLIIGGDLLDLAGTVDLDVQAVVAEKYLGRLRQSTRVVVCSGNHDIDERDAAGESFSRWLAAAGAERLHVDGESVDLPGLRITICPWWDGPVAREAVERQLIAAAPPPGTRWLWVYHAPPEGPLSWTGRKFAGDSFLSGWIERFSPDYVLCGHIHHAPFYAEGAWAQRKGRTWIFNPGRQPGDQPTALWLNLEAGTARWVSAGGVETKNLHGPLPA